MRFLALFAVLFAGLAPTVRAVDLLTTGAIWQFLATDAEPDPSNPGLWREDEFDDSGWLAGAAPLARGLPGAVAVVPGVAGGLLARTQLVVRNPGDYATLRFEVAGADGVVLWLNGVEVLRDGVAPDVASPGATAIGPAGSVHTVAVVRTRDQLQSLRPGTNRLAALILPATGGGPVSFDLSVTGDPDLVAPEVISTEPIPGSEVRELKTIEVQFSEAVRGVDAADLIVNGQPAAAVQQVGLGQFVFTLPDLTSPTVEAHWATGHGITDLATVGNPFAGGSWNYTVDTTAVPDGVILSEFMAKNGKTLRDEDADYSDWLELFNTGATDVSLAGWTLTDDPAVPAKWAFPDLALPARGFLVVFASAKDRTSTAGRLHTNFKLNAGGGYLGLYGPDGLVVSEFSPKYPPQKTDVSYGRVNGASDVIGFFDKPTPGAANSTAGSGFAPGVDFATPSRTYDTALTVALALDRDDPNAVIRYTIDRTLPAATSSVYVGPIVVTNAVHVRARAFSPGKLPGPVSSETYIPLAASAAAVVSDLPILLIHDYGRGRPSTAPGSFATVQVFEPVNGVTTLTNAPTLSQRALIQTRGSSTEGLAKVSLKMEFQNEFGQDEVASLLGMPAESDWVLYAPNLFDPIMTHNPLSHRLFRDLGWYSSRTRYAEVYLVGTGTGPVTTASYQGIYVVEEKIKQGKNRVDVDKLQPENVRDPEVTGGYLFKVDRPDPGDSGFPGAGTTMLYLDPKEPLIKRPERAAQRAYVLQYFKDFGAALNGPNFGDPTNGYAKYLKLDESIDFHILNTLSFNVDALVLSTYFYKPRGGRLSFGPMWDYDRAWGSTDGRDLAPKVWGSNFFDAYWMPRLFRDLEFLQKWIDRYEALRTGELSLPHMFGLLDEFTGQLKQAQPRERAKWGTVYRGGTYAGEITFSKNWLSNRLAFMDGRFVPAPIVGPSRLQPPPGHVELSLLSRTTNVNSILYYTTDGTDPRLAGGALSPTALAYPGGGSVVLDRNTRVKARVFNPDHKLSIGGNLAPLVSKWGGLYDAAYVATPEPLLPTEIHYHPAEMAGENHSAADLEFLEFKNAGANRLSLEGFRLSGGVTFGFGGTNPIRELGPGGRCVVVANAAAFAERYPAVTAIAGEYQGHLSDGGDHVQVLGPVGEIVADVVFDPTLEPLADGAGWSLVPRTEAAAPPQLNNPGAWRLSAFPDGSPGEADQASRPAPDGDLDGDGLPDVWERAHGLRTDSAVGDDGADGDPDHDGRSNYGEFLAGTDPRLEASRVTLVADRTVDRVVRLHFSRQPGRACRVVAQETLGGEEKEGWDFPARGTAGDEEITVTPGPITRFFQVVFP